MVIYSEELQKARGNKIRSDDLENWSFAPGTPKHLLDEYAKIEELWKEQERTGIKIF
jgi:hypothetical protein